MYNVTCPNCGYRYSVKQYSKELFFKPIWQSWSCDKCGTPIKFDPKRRIIKAIIICIALFSVFQIKDYFEMGLFYMTISILFLLLTTILLTLFDKIVLSNKYK